MVSDPKEMLASFNGPVSQDITDLTQFGSLGI